MADGIFEFFDLGFLFLDLWIELFQCCLFKGNGCFEFSFAGKIEALEFVVGV